jgi:hypothetical protein
VVTEPEKDPSNDASLDLAPIEQSNKQTHLKIDATSMIRGMSNEKPAEDLLR